MPTDEKLYSEFKSDLEKYASDLTATYGQRVDFSPEDQLKGPIKGLIEIVGEKLKIKVGVVSEVQAGDVGGRPDLGVAINTLLSGFVELKAPGKGADPKKFKLKGDKEQWSKFQNLPNLLYTDGNEWALYRSGERIGPIVMTAGNVTTEGQDSINEKFSEALFFLLRDFLYWKPIVPSSPKALAKMIGPLCRYLKSDVVEALKDPDSALSTLANDWRRVLFPDADDNQFADAYAQTLTYALLLARLTGEETLTIPTAIETIRSGHRMLSETLKILSHENARKDISVPVELLERVIAAVDPEKLTKKGQIDPWLYFYEDFLSYYDPKMRKDRGVYYTPVEVVRCQVRLVAELLSVRFGADYSFADDKVVTLDPAAGTGTYILAALHHGLEEITKTRGEGMRASAASRAAENIHAFELLVGPYAVAHLRLTQAVLAENGSLPADGAHVYLTDTLESPYESPPQLSLGLKELGEEHKRALKVKSETPVLVCLGNPPYDRQHVDVNDEENVKRKGGWVRYGDKGEEGDSIFSDFLKPLSDLGLGVHAKNLYNDYVYFWRWALWKIFENGPDPGIVSFITASSYLRGPGFVGMRKVMREIFDELWIIDLEGDNLGARKTDNVFAIQTPVAIATGVRYGEPNPNDPAVVRYTKISGEQNEKLAQLDSKHSFDNFEWRTCLSGWSEPLLPTGDSEYWSWPGVTDIFPWQVSGVQFKRKWPIGETVNLILRRWKQLVSLPTEDRKIALRETGARKISNSYWSLLNPANILSPIEGLEDDAVPLEPVRYAYRSFDRQWILPDNRVCDRPRPAIWAVHSSEQIYLTSMLTGVLGEGPAAVVTPNIPDLDHFRGSFGGAHVVPLWKDKVGKIPNITHGILEIIMSNLGIFVDASDLFSYTYLILATPKYVSEFWDELSMPGPRLPVTKTRDLFQRAVTLGKQLIWLHSYGDRFIPEGERPGKVPPGMSRCKVGTPSNPEEYPKDFDYSPDKQELYVGKGVFNNVRPEVLDFSVSGLEVVRSWLGYRMENRYGKKSSPLDDLRPSSWKFDDELLDLLWVLDRTIDLLPEVNRVFSEITKGKLFTADELPEPKDEERKGPEVRGASVNGFLPGIDDNEN